ncbi:MAG: MFS transporter [Planctomycetes bacterium]|nr:MFS transporter [Planctomycetota bacterium]
MAVTAVLHPELRFDTGRSWKNLALNTLAFTVCFAAWMLNGVLITFLVDNGVYKFTPVEMSWLMGIPVLTGSIFRLPLGVMTDKYGGRVVFGGLLLLSAVPMYLTGYCDGFWQFCLASLGFGFTGCGFAVGIAFSSVWFSKRRQGTALGIFGAGNAGAAATSMGAPVLLNYLTANGEQLEGWRDLPKIYAAVLVAMGLAFLALADFRIPPGSAHKSLRDRLAPLKYVRVWRFGFYYFFVFGGFVALAQWLIPYYVNAYAMSVATAGLLAAVNSLPSGVIRAFGGWMSDRLGARTVMYWVFGLSIICCALMIVPQMDVQAPGSGVMARGAGKVVKVTDQTIVVAGKAGEAAYPIKSAASREVATPEERASGVMVLPRSASWQEPVVKEGDAVAKKQLLARGVTRIFFQANVWVFTGLSLLLGAVMGIGKAAVYKHIPDYFPNDVGVVGGIVGVIGGLGGFVCPIIFGYLLSETGLWTSCWMFFLGIVITCLLWMHLVVRRLTRQAAPAVMREIEDEVLVTVGAARGE